MPLVLAYWKIRGLAQPIRLLLNYVGQDFENRMYEQGEGPEFSRKAWDDVKDTLGFEFPNLPYCIDGDLKITQSNAILRHIARKHDLLGKTEQEKVNVDMMLDTAMDIRNKVVSMAYNPDYNKLIEEYKATACPQNLGRLEGWLTKRKYTWFAGANVTVADFHMYEMMDQHRLMIPNVLDKYPKLTEFVHNFEKLPQIKAYMASDKFIKRPVNNKAASFK